MRLDDDTQMPELDMLRGGNHRRQSPDDDGCVKIAATEVPLRAESGRRLVVQMAEQQNTRQALPGEQTTRQLGLSGGLDERQSESVCCG